MNEPASNPASMLSAPWRILGAVWFFLAIVCFFRCELPNNPDWPTTLGLANAEAADRTRTGMLPLMPAFVDNIFTQLTGGERPDQGWQNFQGSLLLWAALIVGGATAIGRIGLRWFAGERTATENIVLGFGLGISALSLLVLGCGLAGWLNSTFFAALLAVGLAVDVVWSWVAFVRRPRTTADPDSQSIRAIVLCCLLLCAPMLFMILLGALSPPVDFDVREYHLQGPKEYFQDGGIWFLPHNAYTSFPFLTEMLSLLGMVVTGEWFRGALVGKLTLAAFAPMSALAIVAAGRRWFDARAGWLGAAIFLTVPWIYRISIIAYAEGGLTFFLMASALAVSQAVATGRREWLFLAGLLCGSAMACKYPGLISVVIPGGLAVAWSRRTEGAGAIFRSVLLFGAGVLITAGPWLVKNVAQTGNPVYPLAWSVFGGTDWTPEINARWRAGHSPPNYAISDLAERVVDVSVRSDWQSPLLLALAPLALLDPRWRRAAACVWLFALWLFAAWWLLTHRIDRFWVPGIPIVALLSGVGWRAFGDHWSKYPIAVAVVGCITFTTGFSGTPLGGFNAWLMEPANAAAMVENRMLRTADQLNRPGGRILCVGEAAVFEARSAVVYNTVFDLNRFQQLVADRVTGGRDEDAKLLPREEIRARLAGADIRLIYVNWQEVLRYREPGSYGFSHFVEPPTFDQLVDLGVIERVRDVRLGTTGLSAHAGALVHQWGLADAQKQYRAHEIFRVVAAP